MPVTPVLVAGRLTGRQFLLLHDQVVVLGGDFTVVVPCCLLLHLYFHVMLAPASCWSNINNVSYKLIKKKERRRNQKREEKWKRGNNKPIYLI